MKIKKTTLLILAIFLFGAFLRFLKIGENLFFNSEQAFEYFQIRDHILAGRIPLLGPPSSHPWFVFGPLYYWLLMPVVTAFNFHPVGVSCFGALVGSLIILLNFWVIRKIFNEKVALFSSFLLAASPFLIQYAREGRFYFFVILPFYLFLWALYKVWQEEVRFLFWVAFSFGVMINFHLSPVAFIPLILFILWTKRKKIKGRDVVQALGGFLIPNISFLVYDATHKMAIATKLLLWIPYRVAGFFGLAPKNKLTPEILRENLTAFYNFFTQSFTIGQKWLGILILILILTFLVLNLKRAFVFKAKKDFGYPFFFWSLFFASLALFLHGSPPRHYFLIICPVLILLFSLILEKIWEYHLGKFLVFAFFLLLTLFNLRFFISSPHFYGPQGQMLTSYAFQEKIAQVVALAAKGERFNLKRVGEFDYYPGEYAYNYRYILWLFGNEPTEERVNLRYTIYEDPKDLPYEVEEQDELFRVGRVFIVRRKGEDDYSCRPCQK